MNTFWDALTDSKVIRTGIIAVLFLLAFFLLIETIASAHDIGSAPAADTITVTGTGKAAALPDIAVINFTVQETGASVSEAQTAATTKTNAALAAVKKYHIDDADVSTISYNVMPQYEQTPCGAGNGTLCPAYLPPANERIVGYEVAETIQVKVRKTEDAGALLQDLGDLGVENISGPNFMVDDDSSVHDAARGKAIADAQTQAQLLAKQLGVHLGKVVSFSENGGGYPSPVMYKAMDAAGSVATAPAPELPMGENETSVTVSVTYEIR